VTRAAGVAAGFVLFAALVTANSGGYRYGISDQAYYQPAVIAALHPTYFPKDRAFLNEESHLMWADQIVAAMSRWTGLDLPPLAFLLYVFTVIAFFAGAVWYGRALGFSWWTIALFLAMLTLRHRISKTATNSFEGYMHPRTLAFGIGMISLANLARGWTVRALFWIGLAACWHPTTALWFGTPVLIAMEWNRRGWRRPWIALALAGAAIALAGPLGSRLIVMDSAWVEVLRTKDYLFPLEWPAYALILNFGYPAVTWLIYRWRRRIGVARPAEGAMVAGVLTLVVVFLVALVLTAFHVALAVQLQVTRIFWVLDFVTIGYLAWALVDGIRWPRAIRMAIIGLFVAASATRGIYILRSAEPVRPLVQIALPSTPWMDAMTWIKTQPTSWHVLADPAHAGKYGVSVRLGAERDTMLEQTKDAALAIYSRDIAMRVRERFLRLLHYGELSTPEFRTLAKDYALDVAIVESSRKLDLPELYRNSQFVVYDLR
jgi:hypothetical protein